MKFKLPVLLVLVFLCVGAYGQNPDLPDKLKPEVAKVFPVYNLQGEVRIVGSDPWLEKLTVLHIWGVWCGPCRQELPSFVKFADSNPDLEVISVATMTNKRGSLPDFLKSINFFDNPHNLKVYIGSTENIIFADNYYVVYQFPTTLFVDNNGKIVLRIEREVDWQSPEIAKILKNFRTGKNIINPFAGQ